MVGPQEHVKQMDWAGWITAATDHKKTIQILNREDVVLDILRQIYSCTCSWH